MNSLPTFYLSNSWYLSFSVLGGHLQESQCFLLPAIAGRLSLLASFVAYTSMIYLSRVSDYLFLLGFVSPSLLVSWCNSTFWCNSIGQEGKPPSRLGRSHLCNRIFLSSRDNSPNAQVCPFHGRSSRLSFDCFIDFLAHYWLLFISVVHRHFHSGHYSAQVFLTKDFLLVDYWVGLISSYYLSVGFMLDILLLFLHPHFYYFYRLLGNVLLPDKYFLYLLAWFLSYPLLILFESSSDLWIYAMSVPSRLDPFSYRRWGYYFPSPVLQYGASVSTFWNWLLAVLFALAPCTVQTC